MNNYFNYRHWVKLHVAKAQNNANHKTCVLVDLLIWKNLVD